MIQRFCDWLSSTWLSQEFSGLDWIVPMVQTIHILGISVVITLLTMLNLRLLRITQTGPTPQRMAVTYVPWVWRSLVVLFVTGVMLTIAEPSRELMNPLFRMKMLLVSVLSAITVVLRTTLQSDSDYWTGSRQRRVIGRAIALAGLIVCVSIVACGRFIAYW
jgi:hypothetical protein